MKIKQWRIASEGKGAKAPNLLGPDHENGANPNVLGCEMGSVDRLMEIQNVSLLYFS